MIIQDLINSARYHTGELISLKCEDLIEDAVELSAILKIELLSTEPIISHTTCGFAIPGSE